MTKPAKHSRKLHGYRTRFFIESLEPRRLLATLVNAKTVTYEDVDSDIVTVALSKAVLTSSNVNSIFKFATGSVNGDNSFTQQLQTIDLTQLGAAAAGGMNITITAKSNSDFGDGFVNVGFINGTGINLGTVSIHGDLGRIDAGDGTSATLGLTTLTVHSMGRFGTSTQAAGGSLESDIDGQLGKLSVASDIAGAYIHVTGPGGAVLGTIGSVSVGGSLIGGSVADSGSIRAGGNMGAVSIGQDVQGGNGQNSGEINSDGKLASVKIGGSVVGGSGGDTGFISSTGDMGAVSIGQNLQGGSGLDSGGISSIGKLASVKIGGSVVGGSFTSGRITSTGDMGGVSIGHDLQGGGMLDSGEIISGGKLASVTIGGSVVGGGSTESGFISSTGDIGAVSIGQNLQGGDGEESGAIESGGKLASVKIGGSVIGGGGSGSGFIRSVGDMGAVSIGQTLQGGDGQESGAIVSEGKLASVKIGGSVIGGSETFCGLISSTGDMGAITIGGNLQGSSGAQSGAIVSEGKLASVTIGGSVIGGSDAFTGFISSAGDMGAVTIAQNLEGGSGQNESGFISSAGDIGAVSIGDSLISGTGSNSGDVVSGTIMGQVKIGGSIVGNSTVPAIISALGLATPKAPNDIAIAGLTVGGRVEDADIFAGYSFNSFNFVPTDADAQIGNVSVGGDWIASNLLAGAEPSGDTFEKITGGTDNAAITSSIGSITIGGQVLGTPATINNADSYGFAAESVKSLSIGGTKIKLASGPHNDFLTLGATADVAIQEV